MKLQELLSKIQENPKVRRVDFIEKHPPYYFYRVMTKEADDLVREFAVCIVVENEGTENEVAFFKDSRPFTMTKENPSPIKEKKRQIEELCNYVKIESFTINRDEEYALVTGYVSNDDGTVSRKTFLVYLDAEGNLVAREVV